MESRVSPVRSLGYVIMLILLSPVILVLLVVHVVTWPFTGGPKEVLYRFWRPLDVRAVQLRPDPLPDVEPELGASRPRPLVWRVRPGLEITRDMHEALRDWIAVRAWVTRVERWRDSEGPEVRIWLCWEADGRLCHTYLKRGFDAYHAYMYNAIMTSWFDRTFVQGGTCTVLHQPGRPKRFRVFGEMELYLDRSLAQIVKEHAEGEDPEKRKMLLDEVNTVLGAVLPWAQQDDELRSALAVFCRTEMTRQMTITDLGKKVYESVRDGTCDESRLASLSEVTGKYVPGAWAAR